MQALSADPRLSFFARWPCDYRLSSTEIDSLQMIFAQDFENQVFITGFEIKAEVEH